MPHSDESRQKLEDVWRERVDEAFQRYERAKAESAKALAECLANPSDETIRALKCAHRVEDQAVQDYMRALQIFHALIVEGKHPPDTWP